MKSAGHIRERSPGHFAIVLDVRDPETGKRKRKWHSFRGTKREAQIECARLISAIQGGTYLEPSKTTVAAYLDHWLGHIKSQVSPRSYERYCELVRKNIVPLLGAVHLSKLKPTQISAAYAKALINGRRDGKGGLAPTTVLYMHRLIKQALGQAVRWELLSRNVADAVDPPKIERNVLTTYDMAQTAELLEALRGTRLRLPVLLGVMCGLRRGEIIALRWRNIDFAAGQLSVVESAEQTADRCAVQISKVGQGTHHSVVRDGCIRIASASPKSSTRASQAWCQADQRHFRIYPSGRRADAAAQPVAHVGFLLHASSSHSISRSETRPRDAHAVRRSAPKGGE